MSVNSGSKRSLKSLNRSVMPRIWAPMLIACVVLLPLVSLVVLAFAPAQNILGQLWETVLLRYVANSILLSLTVGTAAFVMGTSLAFLVTQFDFPGRRWLQYALFLPLAVPGYIAAFVLVDFLEYAGPLQTWLRQIFGWTTKAEYWFPEIRSFGGAAIVLTLSLSPYVYLLTRSVFRDRSASLQDVVRSMGVGQLGIYVRVALPMARPAIAAGVLIVMMETLSDFGTVEFFAVQTITTGIFSIWLDAHNAGGAAQLALFALSIIFVLIALERNLRGRAGFAKGGRNIRTITPIPLHGVSAWLATVACFVPFALGFLLPVTLLLSHSMAGIDGWGSHPFWAAMSNSAVLGVCAAVLTIIGSLIVVVNLRNQTSRMARVLVALTTLGYAVPGAVLAVGLLIPIATFENWFADLIFDHTGWDPGLMISGGIGLLIMAYVVRFFAIGVGAVEGGMASLSPSLVFAARSLGKTQGETTRSIVLPHIRPALISASLLIFVDTVKELPATLLLRPFNSETLATLTYAYAQSENLSAAAGPALLIVTLSIVATILVARSNR